MLEGFKETIGFMLADLKDDRYPEDYKESIRVILMEVRLELDKLIAIYD